MVNIFNVVKDFVNHINSFVQLGGFSSGFGEFFLHRSLSDFFLFERDFDHLHDSFLRRIPADKS